MLVHMVQEIAEVWAWIEIWINVQLLRAEMAEMAQKTKVINFTYFTEFISI